jgi:hypothetical protein
MELLHLFAPIIIASKGLAFYFKITFIILLFVLNMYLIFTYKKEELSNKELQSGFNIQRLKGLLGTLGYVGGFLSAAITVKNELKSVQIGKLDQLQTEERENIRRSIDKDKEEHQRLLVSINNNREELSKLHQDKTKLIGLNDRLLTLHDSIKNNVVSFQNKSTEPSTKLSDLGILDQLIKRNTEKFGNELNSVILQFDSSNDLFSSEITPAAVESQNPAEDIRESCINPFNFDLNSISQWQVWFEGLNGIKKIAVSMIISKSVVFSALVSIIFIFYGNILIEKYDLVNKYPRLATLIQLRQKFQKYYFNYYCGLIFMVVITEIAFGIAILLL